MLKGTLAKELLNAIYLATSRHQNET